MADESDRPSVDGPLDDVNDAFHELYDRARALAEREPPVIVVLADTIVLFRNSERSEWSYSPKVFHIVKSVAHAPVALYGALLTAKDCVLDAAVETKVRALGDHVSASFAQLDEALDATTRDHMRSVLDGTQKVVTRVLGQGRVSELERAELARLGPTLGRLIDEATGIQLESLHASVSAALATLDADERESLQVVVTGDHQARVRSLGMQYFQKLLREPEGSEERVTYAEGVSDEDEARALVGTRRLDRALAATFFGDPKRLQRDLLGDAAKARLADLDL